MYPKFTVKKLRISGYQYLSRQHVWIDHWLKSKESIFKILGDIKKMSNIARFSKFGFKPSFKIQNM